LHLNFQLEFSFSNFKTTLPNLLIHIGKRRKAQKRGTLWRLRSMTGL